MRVFWTKIVWNAFNLNFRIALIWKYSSASGVAAAFLARYQTLIAHCLGMSEQEKIPRKTFQVMGRVEKWGMQ
jgi:hypothetical protein